MHEETLERLPEFAAGTLAGAEAAALEAHLDGCEDCRQELALLTELRDIPCPDPGDLFWKELPCAVQGKLGPARQGWPARLARLADMFQPLPLAAAAVATLAVFVMFHIEPAPESEMSRYFQDPLRASGIDYEPLAVQEEASAAVPVIQEAEAIELAEAEGGYYREVASLDAEELDGLVQLMNAQQNEGG